MAKKPNGGVARAKAPTSAEPAVVAAGSSESGDGTQGSGDGASNDAGVAAVGTVASVMLEVPVATDGSNKYAQRGFNNPMSGPNAATMRRVIDGYAEAGVKLASGKAIVSPDDVVAHWLERIDAGLVNAATPGQGS